jgi:ArsR family transcriptional regulator
MLLVERHGELCVCELMSALGDSQPKVSRHLASLRGCGLLRDQRRGQWVYYSLPSDLPDWVRRVLVQGAIAEAGELKKLEARLAAMDNRPQRCAIETGALVQPV